MSLDRLVGHEETRRALARAAARGELPGSLLLHGPPGVGKQRVGLWLAQSLLCTAPTPEGACNACTSCRLALRLEHPDLHWYFPVARPKASGGPERLAEALESARAAELAERREAAWLPVGSGESASYYVAMIQNLRREALARPAMGRSKIILLGDAERLVPQESSQEAANALLKLLEEPPPATIFILTASDPESLLPTIRSRLLPVRLRPLPASVVEDYLTGVRGLDPPEAARIARLSAGAIGTALGYAGSDGAPGALAELRDQARALLDAAAAPEAAVRYGAALATAPAAARGAFSDLLDFLVAWIRDLAAVAAGAHDQVVNADALPYLESLAQRLPGARSGAASAVGAVQEAMELAYGNVNPQLVLSALLRDLHAALHGAE